MEAEPPAENPMDAMLQEDNEETDEEDELLNELLALLDEDEEQEEEVIDESLTVDMGEVKHGSFVTDKGTRDYDAEMELAKQESTAYKAEAEELEKEVGELRDSILVYQDKQEKMRTVLDDMKGKLEEMVIQNARLIYSNKVLSDASLNERQKDKIVEAISNATTVEEAKIIFETLQSAVGIKSKKTRKQESLNEVVTRSSSAFIPRKEVKPKTDAFSDRMKRLAGLK